MEAKQSVKKLSKQLTAKRDDTPLHSAARSGDLGLVLDIISGCEGVELKELLSKQNQSGETVLYAAAECGFVELLKELMNHCDVGLAGIKARNGYDAFHIAAKQGDLGNYVLSTKSLMLYKSNLSVSCLEYFSEMLKVLMEAMPELSMTFDLSNTTALHTASSQGHIDVVNFLLETGSNLAAIAKRNGKTALHSAARKGHVEIVKALLHKEPGIATRNDKKGQTALHMASKGQHVELVDVLIKVEPSLVNMVDSKGNTALHIAARKGRSQIAEMLLSNSSVEKAAINKSGETALDTSEKSGHTAVAAMLQEYGVPNAKSIKPSKPNPARELKQTVSDIKHEVHDQLEHTKLTRKRVHGIAKRLNKMHVEGLNNAINSTTVVAVLIATVAFAAIFTLPGQYPQDTDHLPPGASLGQANIARQSLFTVFFIFDSLALFISLAVVVVQTSVVVSERKAKQQVMSIINKLMWLACVMISVAFLALSYIVVGPDQRWLAVGVTGIGTVIMALTLGTLCYWIVINKVEASKQRSLRRSSMSNLITLEPSNRESENYGNDTLITSVEVPSIVMEIEEKKNLTDSIIESATVRQIANNTCDVTKGRWVYDESYPLYTNITCPFIDESFSCQRNGRLDNTTPIHH
ncbi:hypothetical protein ACFE04_002326 [Oxalis oulophora]